MEKKNTMLLTVIAVATLLVAVVGATFAYFSVTASTSGTGASTVKGSANATGTITSTGGEKSLFLSLAGTDMAQTAAGTTYWATDATKDAGVSNYNTSKTEYTVATFNVDGGETNYTCTYKYDVNVTVTDATKYTSALTDNSDINVYFSGAGVATASYTIGELIAGTKTLSGTVNLVPDTEQTLKISSSFANTNAVQDALAGLSYTISVTPAATDGFKCVTANDFQ